MIERNYHETRPRGMQGRAFGRRPLHKYRNQAKSNTGFLRAQERRGVSGEERGVRDGEERGELRGVREEERGVRNCEERGKRREE